MQMQINELKKANYIKSCINYTGGKYRLLNQIMPLIPSDIDTFWDVFCGGCNVGINAEANTIKFNDKITQLIDLYKVLQEVEIEEAINIIEDIIEKYSLSNTYKNSYEVYSSNSSSGLSEYNKKNYIKLRQDYNNIIATKHTDIIIKNIMLYVLSVYGFNNQLRFNKKGQYNIPVGKRDFNEKIRNNFISFMKQIKNKKIFFENRDFKSINYDECTRNDFVYADPPYLITTATYNEQGGWTEEDEKYLLNILDCLNFRGVRFALSNVLESKGKTNEILLHWSRRYNIHNLDYNYSNSNYQKKNKDKKDVEVLITNY